jgi:hypothetical protein
MCLLRLVLCLVPWCSIMNDMHIGFDRRFEFLCRRSK